MNTATVERTTTFSPVTSRGLCSALLHLPSSMTCSPREWCSLCTPLVLIKTGKLAPQRLVDISCCLLNTPLGYVLSGKLVLSM